jgi:hypothetical protein
LTCSNIICAASGPDAGKIVGIIDFEGAASMPLWYLGAPRNWFFYKGLWGSRDAEDTAAFKKVYAERLRELGHDEQFIVYVDDSRGRGAFAALASTPWINADGMEEWLKSGREV